jgi:hypothetical protein
VQLFRGCVRRHFHDPCSQLRHPVPPQNLVDGTIVDVSALRASWPTPMLHLLYALLATTRSSLKPQRELAPETLASRQQLAIVLRTTSHRATHPSIEGWNRCGFIEACLHESSFHHWAALIAIEEARPKPGSLMAVTPTMRSWNQFSAFIEEWDGLRIAVR